MERMSRKISVMDELTLDERNNDVWFKDNNVDEKYVIVIMYSTTGESAPRFITSTPMFKDTTKAKLERMINDWEQGRAVCLNAHFVNPNNIITIKMDVFKRDRKRGDYDDY